MAKIVIDGLPTAYNAKLPFTFADLHLDLQEMYLINDPLNQQPEINDIKLDYDIDAIKNSIKNLFFTAPGEKILNPEFGLDLRQFLFEPVTSDNSYSLERIIYGELGRFEPRIVLQTARVVPDPQNDAYQITLTFAVPTLNITNANLFGVLNKNGYTYI